jgi:hypothetical protein
MYKLMQLYSDIFSTPATFVFNRCIVLFGSKIMHAAGLMFNNNSRQGGGEEP